MPSRALPALAVAAALVLTACGSGAQPSSDASGQLPDGVAARVGDTEIEVSRLDERVDRALENPQLAQQLPQDEEQARTLVAANVLNQMILTEAVLQAGEQEGIEVTEEDVAATRKELEDQAGGADALQEQVDAIGFDDEELDRELRSLAILEQVAEREAPEAGPTATPAPPGQPNPADLAVQTWLQEQMGTIEITVDEQYGHWDAERLQVVPPESAMPQPPVPPSPAPTS